MSKTRFTQWVVFACIGTLAGCTSGEGGTAGNTELNVMVPSGGGSSSPFPIDIEEVEYTINCDAPDVTAPGLGVDSIEPTFNPDVTINGALEVLDTASGAVTTQDFGVNLDEVYVWQGFMDIPLNAVCTVQLRARDGDGEVICTDTVDFDTETPFVAGDTVKVNVLMYCGISFQAPVAMLDLDGDFSFNISNFCPDLFVLNCLDSEITDEDFLTIGGTVLAGTGCQVRFRDGDSQCGDSCDPQTCVTDTEGLTCTAADGNRKCDNDLAVSCAENGDADCPTGGNCIIAGVTTVVTCFPPSFKCAAPGATFGDPCNPAAADFGNGDCGFPPPNGTTIPAVCSPSAVMDCNGVPNEPSLGEPPFDTQCTYQGDTLGNIGDPPPFPIIPGPGEGGFFVTFVVRDNDGLPSTPVVPIDPGATITCTAVTTDGDTDCNKSKVVQVKGPGLSACATFGGDPACQASSTTVCQVGTCDNGTCDGSTPAACCDFADAANGTDCSVENGGLAASCQGGVCVAEDCNAVGCEDSNDCTQPQTCNTGTGACEPAPPLNVANGTTCDVVNGSGAQDGVCDTGTCTAFVCDDPTDCGSNPCIDYACDTGTPAGSCSEVENDNNTCDTCAATPDCLCDAGACVDDTCPPPPSGPVSINNACRNSFNQAVSVFPITLDVALDDCAAAGQPFNAAVTPAIALDTSFLQAAAETVCTDLGSNLTEADVTLTQVSVNSVAGANCNVCGPDSGADEGNNCVNNTDCDGGAGTCGDALSELWGGITCTSDADCENAPGGLAGDVCDTGSGECSRTLALDVTFEPAGCSCPNCDTITVNAGLNLPMPDVSLACTADNTPGDDVAFCNTGVTPFGNESTESGVSVGDTPVDTWVKVAVAGGILNVAFGCGGPAEIFPATGAVQVQCASANDANASTPAGLTCGQDQGVGDFPVIQESNCVIEDIEDPNLPVQTCLLGGVLPTPCSGLCSSYPVALDPLTTCPTFNIEP